MLTDRAERTCCLIVDCIGRLLLPQGILSVIFRQCCDDTIDGMSILRALTLQIALFAYVTLGRLVPLQYNSASLSWRRLQQSQLPQCSWEDDAGCYLNSTTASATMLSPLAASNEPLLEYLQASFICTAHSSEDACSQEFSCEWSAAQANASAGCFLRVEEIHRLHSSCSRLEHRSFVDRWQQCLSNWVPCLCTSDKQCAPLGIPSASSACASLPDCYVRALFNSSLDLFRLSQVLHEKVNPLTFDLPNTLLMAGVRRRLLGGGLSLEIGPTGNSSSQGLHNQFLKCVPTNLAATVFTAEGSIDASAPLFVPSLNTSLHLWMSQATFLQVAEFSSRFFGCLTLNAQKFNSKIGTDTLLGVFSTLKNMYGEASALLQDFAVYDAEGEGASRSDHLFDGLLSTWSTAQMQLTTIQGKTVAPGVPLLTKLVAVVESLRIYTTECQALSTGLLPRQASISAHAAAYHLKNLTTQSVVYMYYQLYEASGKQAAVIGSWQPGDWQLDLLFRRPAESIFPVLGLSTVEAEWNHTILRVSDMANQAYYAYQYLRYANQADPSLPSLDDLFGVAMSARTRSHLGALNFTFRGTASPVTQVSMLDTTNTDASITSQLAALQHELQFLQGIIKAAVKAVAVSTGMLQVPSNGSSYWSADILAGSSSILTDYILSAAAPASVAEATNDVAVVSAAFNVSAALGSCADLNQVPCTGIGPVVISALLSTGLPKGTVMYKTAYTTLVNSADCLLSGAKCASNSKCQAVPLYEPYMQAYAGSAAPQSCQISPAPLLSAMSSALAEVSLNASCSNLLQSPMCESYRSKAVCSAYQNCQWKDYAQTSAGGDTLAATWFGPYHAAHPDTAANGTCATFWPALLTQVGRRQQASQLQQQWMVCRQEASAANCSSHTVALAAQTSASPSPALPSNTNAPSLPPAVPPASGSTWNPLLTVLLPVLVGLAIVSGVLSGVAIVRHRRKGLQGTPSSGQPPRRRKRKGKGGKKNKKRRRQVPEQAAAEDIVMPSRVNDSFNEFQGMTICYEEPSFTSQVNGGQGSPRSEGSGASSCHDSAKTVDVGKTPEAPNESMASTNIAENEEDILLRRSQWLDSITVSVE